MTTRPNSAARLALAAATLAALTAPAMAQGPDVQAALKDPAVQTAISACQGDRARLCPTVVPGGGRIIRCLAGQEAQVSPACRTAIYAARDSLVAGGVIDPAQFKR